MMGDFFHRGVLCKDLPLQSWNVILELGREANLSGQCWLETYNSPDETIAMLLSGHIGLRPISGSIDENQDILLRAAPIIIDLPDDPDSGYGHWLVDDARVYFYTQSALSHAFSKAPQFALNVVLVLQAQQSAAIMALKNPNRNGLKRLATSLLARLDELNNEQKILFVTQAELAAETGLSRQWVNYLLKQLEKKGIAKPGRGQIFLSSASRLEKAL